MWKTPGYISYPFIHVYHKSRSYDVWFLRYEVQQTEFFVILDRFLPIYPPNSRTNENIKNEKKKNPGDIIILHKCTKTHDHRLYCSWDMAPDVCNFHFSFWAIFCPFTPLTAQKIKFSKQWKKPWRYHHFTCVYQKLWLDEVWFLRYGARLMEGRMDKQTDRKSDI